MDYKEKLQEAKRLYETANADQKYVLESLFPELCESEDEKIRKELIDHINHLTASPKNIDKYKTWITWLEKQGKNSVCKVKIGETYKCIASPRYTCFRMGDIYYVKDNFVAELINICSGCFVLLEKQGESYTKRDVDNAWLEGMAFAKRELEKQGECHISHDDEIMIKQLTEYFTTGHGLQNTNETVVEWLNDVKEKLEKRGEVESDNDDIEAEEKGIREAFNKIEDEKQGKQKVNPCDECINVKGCINCENGELRETEQKPAVKMKTPEESLGINSDIYNEIVDKCIYGEQKSANEVEPKFKVGDWITNGDYTWKIVEVKPLDYILQSQDGNIVDDTIYHVNEQFHSFTIQDAKEGDVLYCENSGIEYIVMNKGINKCNNIDSYFRYNSKDGFDIGVPSVLSAESDIITPATKEQRDLLFQKMKEAGYEWDAEKKELKKIGQEQTIDYPENLPKDNWELVHEFVEKFGRIPKDEDELNALVEYILKRQKSAWSEEDEKTIHNIDAAIRHEVVFPIDELKSMEIWLESLKYRIRSKHEWKRDEKMFQLIEDIINVYRKTQGSVIGGVHIEELKDFLNCIASKQDWKPSNEQLEIIDMLLTNESMDDNIARILRELREQLKKLREE